MGPFRALLKSRAISSKISVSDRYSMFGQPSMHVGVTFGAYLDTVEQKVKFHPRHHGPDRARKEGGRPENATLRMSLLRGGMLLGKSQRLRPCFVRELLTSKTQQ